MNCIGQQACNIDFPTFPAVLAGKFVTINEVSCAITIGAPAKLSQAGINVFSRRGRGMDVPNQGGLVSFGNQMNFKVAAEATNRMRLVLVADQTTSIVGSCTIVGLITPN